jgi:threonine dehydratase
VYTVEPETAAALVAARAAGEPTQIEYVPSFVDGSGSRGVLPEMWPQVAPLIDDALSATLDETADALRLMAERLRVIAEGAGALATAAALAGRAGEGKIVAVVSGGNIDFATLARILKGEPLA